MRKKLSEQNAISTRHNPSVSIKDATAGITLIALVITIIVLLILAGVAISMLSGENGILNQAADAKTKTEKASTDEAVKLAALSALTAGHGDMNLDVLNDELTEVAGKDINITELPATVTINGNDYTITGDGTTREATGVEKNIGKEITGSKAILLDENNEQIVVPVGFTIKADSPTIVKRGIVVVAPDNSEFVWVPVKDITKMATETSNSNYQGKLYNFSSTDGGYSAVEKASYGQGTTTYREPSLVTGNNADTYAILETVTGTSYDASSDYYNTILGYSSAVEFGKNMQKDYNEMIESVKINKGFYVGRYETSLNASGYAQSISGANSTNTSNTNSKYWYGLYQKEKEYSENNSLTEKVGSSMIWGSQYDQMMIWMQSNGIDVTLKAPTNLEGVTTSKNTTRVTGSVSTDKLNNIYDLLGNSMELTLEARYSNKRVIRGADVYDESNIFSSRRLSDPSSTNSLVSSRLTLYVR